MVPKPGTTMASNVSVGIALPEPLQDRDTRAWFKRFEVCASANEWDEEKKLKRLPRLLRGCMWAVYDALGENQTDTRLRVTFPSY